MVNKTAVTGQIFQNSINAATGVLKFLASVRVLKALAIGGGLGLLAQSLTAPGARDRKNVAKQLNAALLQDAKNRQKMKFATEYQQKQRQASTAAPTSMRMV